MNYRPHQIAKGEDLLAILNTHHFGYLYGTPRSGKTLTSIYISEKSTNKNILVLAPRSAINGWKETLDNISTTKDYTVSTFDKLTRSFKTPLMLKEVTPISCIKTYSKPKFNILFIMYVGTKELKMVRRTTPISYKYPYLINVRTKKHVLATTINPYVDYLVILDESHGLGAFPKRTKRSYNINKFMMCANMSHIHLSGTPYVESPSALYHQMNLGRYVPFKSKNFYTWHNLIGKPYKRIVAGHSRTFYDKVDLPKLEKYFNRYVVSMTQEDAGITENLQVVDKVHYLELSEDTLRIYKDIVKDKLALDVPTTLGTIDLVADTLPRERGILHALECGVAKTTETTFVLNGDGTDGVVKEISHYYELINREKIDYIKANFDLTKKVGIMSNFPAEREKLKRYLPTVEIFSADGDAEGVDLSHLDVFIIASSSYKGTKHIQRRERIVNINNEDGKDMTVHHLVFKGLLSDHVYKIVSSKKNFNDSVFKNLKFKL